MPVTYLLATDDSAGFTLDDHVLGSSDEHAGGGEVPRFVEILHDAGYLLRLELHNHTEFTSPCET